jgi:O-antigen ligase
LFLIQIQEIPAKFYTYIQLLLVLWMIWELAPSRQRVLGLMTGYVLGAYLAAFDTILSSRKAVSEAARFAAGGADPNENAMVLALALPMAWYLGTVYRQPLLRLLCRAYLPVAIVAVGLTGSRGGMLASVTGLVIVPLTMTRLSPTKLALAIVILAVSGALAVKYVPDKLLERLASTGAEVEDLRFGGRFKLWRAGLHAFTAKPVMGYGTSGFKNAVAPILGPITQVAHNSFLSVLVEQGLMGLLFYSSMFIAVFLSLLRLPVLERRFGLVLLATLGVTMLPLTWENAKPVWFTLAALLGLAHSRPASREPARRPAWPGRIARPPMAERPLEPLTARARNADRDAEV